MANPTRTRKERERGLREELILNHAQRMLLREGFQNFNLDALANAVEYSKGTLYITFSMAAITMGSHIMARNRQLAAMAGIDDPVTVVRQNQDLVLDGLGWKPLSAEWDYAATDQRIKKEIFPEVTWLKM